LGHLWLSAFVGGSKAHTWAMAENGSSRQSLIRICAEAELRCHHQRQP
jgi:hypothetical protein